LVFLADRTSLLRSRSGRCARFQVTRATGQLVLGIAVHFSRSIDCARLFYVSETDPARQATQKPIHDSSETIGFVRRRSWLHGFMYRDLPAVASDRLGVTIYLGDWQCIDLEQHSSLFPPSPSQTMTRPNNAIQPMRARRSAQSRVGNPWRLARTADGGRWATRPFTSRVTERPNQCPNGMRESSQQSQAFTLVELLVVIAVIGTLAALLLPALKNAKARSKTLACVSQLKQIGVASIAFAGDNDERLPAATMPNTNRALSPLQAVSRELGTLKLFLCPADSERTVATNLTSLDRSNI